MHNGPFEDDPNDEQNDPVEAVPDEKEFDEDPDAITDDDYGPDNDVDERDEVFEEEREGGDGDSDDVEDDRD